MALGGAEVGAQRAAVGVERVQAAALAVLEDALRTRSERGRGCGGGRCGGCRLPIGDAAATAGHHERRAQRLAGLRVDAMRIEHPALRAARRIYRDHLVPRRAEIEHAVGMQRRGLQHRAALGQRRVLEVAAAMHPGLLQLPDVLHVDGGERRILAAAGIAAERSPVAAGRGRQRGGRRRGRLGQRARQRERAGEGDDSRGDETWRKARAVQHDDSVHSVLPFDTQDTPAARGAATGLRSCLREWFAAARDRRGRTR